MKPLLETLPEAQQRLWPDLAVVPSRFVLYGGTALALRLGHRISEDFDFFSSVPFAPEHLEREIGELGVIDHIQSSANTLVFMVDRGGPVKLSFFGGLGLRRVAEPDALDSFGWRIASLLDLAATKMGAVQGRAEAKDYLDIARLLDEGIGLDQALGAAKGVYGPSFSPVLSLKALSFFNDGNLASLPAGVRDHLVAATSSVDLGRLTSIPALPGDLSR
ncbi:MAG: nucleotidyl transferase AbiEii/AbiGii toxin family protein [Acidobacteriota bacterium]